MGMEKLLKSVRSEAPTTGAATLSYLIVFNAIGYLKNDSVYNTQTNLEHTALFGAIYLVVGSALKYFSADK